MAAQTHTVRTHTQRLKKRTRESVAARVSADEKAPIRQGKEQRKKVGLYGGRQQYDIFMFVYIYIRVLAPVTLVTDINIFEKLFICLD